LQTHPVDAVELVAVVAHLSSTQDHEQAMHVVADVSLW
jgi:hypothetical protein